MKKYHFSYPLLLSCISIFIASGANAQNIGINATGATPNSSAMLDIDASTLATKKGLLIPRVTSAERAAMNPLPAAAQGLLVYQTDGAQGFYYNTSLTTVPNWIYMSAGWALSGNAGTSSAANFIGTTDAIDFVMRTNNTERARITSSGNIGIGTTTANYARLQVEGMVGNTVGYFGGSSNSKGICLVADNPGVYFNCYWNGGLKSMASSGYASMVNTDQSTGALSFSTNDVPIASANAAIACPERMRIAGNGNVGIGTSAPAGKLDVTNSTTSVGAAIRNTSAANNVDALQVLHSGVGNGIYCNAVGAGNYGVLSIQGNVWPNLISMSTGGATANLGAGKGIVTGGKSIGIEACALEDGDVNTDQLGGMFYVRNGGSGIPAAATVGSVVDNITYKILGFGAVSTIVNDLDEKPVIMAAPEAPEMLFQDFGSGQLVNGRVHISLDPILSKNIKVDATHPLKIFVQLNDDCKGVYIANRNANGFDVIELNGGTSNSGFSWMLTARRKNETHGGVTSDYENFRFKRTNNPAFNKVENSQSDPRHLINEQ